MEIYKMKPKLTWGQLNGGEIKEIKKHYKMTDHDVERQIRRHTDGATKQELRKVYKNIYG